MRVSITGVPGVGKTTISQLVGKSLGMEVVHLNEFAKKQGFFSGFDEERECKIVDIPKIKKEFKNRDNVIFESHFAEEMDVDVIVVLRLDPAEVVERLLNRRYSKKKAMENALAEALDYYTPKEKKNVFQVDTTGLTPYDIVYKVVRAIKEKVGDDIDFSYWIEKNLETLEKLGL
jgi:adenylate kinase